MPSRTRAPGQGRWRGLPLAGAALAACEGPQSALAPAGRDAARIADLFYAMSAGALVVWAAVVGSALYAVLRKDKRHSQRAANLFVLGGGVVTPTVLLTVLLVAGLWQMPELMDWGSEHARPRVSISGEQWWWRVRYLDERGDTIELANEVRLPVGRRTPLVLESPDVIHSFWIPPSAPSAT
ncbi:MAG: hypothetical protein M5U28_31110 [Sandaracinaceae bacterium]|nr:hypothetical protein [Sandaracinaceae bacterium]